MIDKLLFINEDNSYMFRRNIVEYDMQTASLVTTNQKETLREMLTIRADNMPGKMRMLSQIEKTGTVRYEDCFVNLNDSQSL